MGYIFLGAMRRYSHPLSKYLGPFMTSITRWWMVQEIFSGQREKQLCGLHNIVLLFVFR